MPFLTINGYTVPVINGSPRRRIPTVGPRSRSFRGQIRDARRGARRMWDIEALFLDFDDAESLAHLVLGEGHHFGWGTDGGLQASTGLMPEPGAGAVYLSDTNLVTFVGGAQGDIFLRYDAQLIDSDWTIAWVENVGGAKFAARRSDGAGFFDGSRDDSTGRLNGPSNFLVDVVDEVLTIGINVPSATGQILHPLDALSWIASDGMIAEWGASISDVSSMAALPTVKISGDIIEEDQTLCVGQISGLDYIQKPTAVPGVGWVNNAKILKFSLIEVPKTWSPDASPVSDIVADTPFNTGEWDNTPNPNLSFDFDTPTNLAEATFNNGWDGTPP